MARFFGRRTEENSGNPNMQGRRPTCLVSTLLMTNGAGSSGEMERYSIPMTAGHTGAPKRAQHKPIFTAFSLQMQATAGLSDGMDSSPAPMMGGRPGGVQRYPRAIGS